MEIVIGAVIIALIAAVVTLIILGKPIKVEHKYVYKNLDAISAEDQVKLTDAQQQEYDKAQEMAQSGIRELNRIMTGDKKDGETGNQGS